MNTEKIHLTFASMFKNLTCAFFLIAQISTAFAEYPPLPAIELEKKVQGEEAIHRLGDKLPAVAAHYGMTEESLRKILRNDRTAWIDERGNLLYVEAFPPSKKITK